MTDRQARDGTVGKAMAVLDRVAAAGRPIRFAELAAQSPYPRATLFRLLQTLTNQGMLAYDPERQVYSLGVRLVRLAHAAWRQSSLAPLARRHLDTLAAELGHTVHLAQLDNGQVLYLDKRTPAVPLDIFSQAGKVGPAYCTGVGKVMLAFLDPPAREQAISQQSFHRFTAATIATAEALRTELASVRARGHAVDREEHEPGIICAAVPILSRSHRVLGALSVTATTARTSLPALEQAVPALARAADAVADAVEAWSFPEDRPSLGATRTG